MIFPCMNFFVIFQVLHDFHSLWEPCLGTNHSDGTPKAFAKSSQGLCHSHKQCIEVDWGSDKNNCTTSPTTEDRIHFRNSGGVAHYCLNKLLYVADTFLIT